MSVRRTVALIGRALRPGADLSQDTAADLKRDPGHVATVDALTALGRIKEPAGIAIVHGKLAGENVAGLQAVILEWCVLEFGRRGWPLPKPKVMRAFVRQAWLEHIGRICKRCKGHGYVGRRLDLVRHHLQPCEPCKGKGYVMVEGTWQDTKTRRGARIRRQCSACRGKCVVPVMEQLKAGKLRMCPECFGAGSAKKSLRARARALGVSYETVRRVWRERFTVVLSELRRIERHTLMECGNFLFDRD